MELKRLSICLTLFVLAYISHCSEARHSRERRDIADDHYEDVLADEATDDEAQNDAEGNDADEDVEIEANIVTNSSDYNATVGGTVRLKCEINPSDGVVVQWTKNSTNYFLGTLKLFEQDLSAYSVDSRFSIAANSTDLLIRDMKITDSGVYKCEILQFNRPYVRHNLVVFESPKIIRFSATNNGEVVEGTDLVLTCEVSGSPSPQIVWSRDEENGNKRLAEKDGEFSLNSVYIKNVKRQHSGKYYCYAFNGVGSNQSEIYINVKSKPRVHVRKNIINSAINVEAVLECSVHDQTAAHIRWYKDGQRIEDTSRQYSVSTHGQHSNLTVIPSNDSDFGTFTCEAENELGSHNRSIDLVQSPVVESLEVDGPRISWTIHSHQPVEQIEIQLKEVEGDGEWKTLNVPVPKSKNHEYDVVYNFGDEVEFGKYEATVKVKNDKSWSVHTDSALVEIEAQPLSIQHASIYRGSAHSIYTSPQVLATAIMYLLVRM